MVSSFCPAAFDFIRGSASQVMCLAARAAPYTHTCRAMNTSALTIEAQSPVLRRNGPNAGATEAVWETVPVG